MIESTATKATDILLNSGVLGVLCVLCILLLIIAGLVIRSLFNELRACDKRISELVVDVTKVTEASKTAAASTASALDGVKTTASALVQAIQDLSREAEGESREIRHGIANVMTVVQANLEVLRTLDTRRRE